MHQRAQTRRARARNTWRRLFTVGNPGHRGGGGAACVGSARTVEVKLGRKRITSRVPPAAPRAKAKPPATASSSPLTVEHLNEAGRCAREGARSVAKDGALNQTNAPLHARARASPRRVRRWRERRASLWGSWVLGLCAPKRRRSRLTWTARRMWRLPKSWCAAQCAATWVVAYQPSSVFVRR